MTIQSQLKAMGIPDDLMAGVLVDGRPLAEVDVPASRRDSVTVLPGGGLAFVVYATPIGKPRMTQRDKWNKRPSVLRYRAWCDRVRALVGGCVPPVELVVELNWRAFFEPPKSWPKKRRTAALGQLHRQTPDRDNIDKAILDCLFKHDSAIAFGTIEKWWDWQERLEVKILTVDDAVHAVRRAMAGGDKEE